MRLFKVIQAVSGLTLIALIYIHLQMQIYDLAYRGKEKKDHILQLSETNAAAAYRILELKSVNHLGARLLTEDRDLCFRGNQNIIQLVTVDAVSPQREIAALQKPQPENSLLSFLTVKAEARNRPPDDRNLFRILGKDR